MNDAFRLWAETYDRAPNALLQLGDRGLIARLGDVAGLRALDAGCGTGRWMRRVHEAGGWAAGFDRELAMLGQSGGAPIAQAELGRAPFRAASFGLAIATFSLSYAEEPAVALADLCAVVRAGGRIAVADLHPGAVEAGWRRTFQVDGRTMEVPSHVEALEAALLSPPPGWRIEALDSLRFGDPERGLFEAEHWERVRDVWAARLAIWRRMD